MRHRNTGKAIVRYLMTIEAAYPGKTLGEIEIALNIPHGTATHQRMTEQRRQGFPIVCKEIDGLHRYYILRAQVPKCAELLKRHRCAQRVMKEAA